MAGRAKYLGVFIFLVLIGQVSGFFKDDYRKFDVFIGSDAKIYIDNIISDVAGLITISTLLLLLTERTRYALPFFIVSLLDIVDYFICYQQFSYIKLPTLITLLFLTLCQRTRG
jgi:hypothetical protein